MKLTSGASVNLYCDSSVARRIGSIILASDCPRQFRGPSPKGINLLALPAKTAQQQEGWVLAHSHVFWATATIFEPLLHGLGYSYILKPQLHVHATADYQCP